MIHRLERLKCNCLLNGSYGGGRRFDRAMDCYKDENFACGVRIADEPLQIWASGSKSRIHTYECMMATLVQELNGVE